MSSVMLQASAALKIMYIDCIRKHVTKNLQSRAGSDANDPSLHFTVMTKAFQVWIMCQPLAAHRSQRRIPRVDQIMYADLPYMVPCDEEEPLGALGETVEL